MPDDTQKRPVSVSKGLKGLVHEDTALGRVPSVKEPFDRAQNPPDQPHSQETEQSKGGAQQGSQTGNDDAAKLGKERGNAGTNLEAARKAQQTCKAKQGKSPNHDNDHEQ